jgi:glycerophosphoryl diester phosphodiesterase
MVIAPWPGMENPVVIPNPPWIVAHRGGRLDAPENTRAAFDAALRYPVDGLELDIQMTRDGVAVLYHDGNLQKICGDRRRIADLDYKTIAGMDWGGWFAGSFAGERILTLPETLERYSRRTRLMIEIKSFLRDRRRGRSLDVTREVLRTIEEVLPPPQRKNIFILSFDREVLDFAHDLQPDWRYVWNPPANEPASPSSRFPDYLHALCLPVHRLSEAFVDEVHERGKRVMTYSCNNPRQVEKARAAAADVIMTDRPKWLCEYFQRMRKRP